MKTSFLVFIGILIGSASYAGDCKNEKANNTSDNAGRALSTEKVEKEAVVVEKKDPESEKARPFHHTGTLENRP